MLWLKCCPRCIDGDVADNQDIYGAYLTCLHCGYCLTETEKAALSSSCLQGVAMRRPGSVSRSVAV